MTKPAHHKLNQHHAPDHAGGSSDDRHPSFSNLTEGHKASLALLREANLAKGEQSFGATKSAPEINRKLYYIDQMNDRRLRGHTFACGPTSLTMALADHCAVNPHTGRPTVHHPPTEQDRIGIIKETGTWAAGEWIGGPARMAAFAKRFGLNAEAYSENNLALLTQCLEQGKGAIVDGHCLRSGHAHYVYVAGRDAHGYIMGDPASPGTTHWTAAHLRAFMTGYGFTAVWNRDAHPGARFVADAGGRGDETAQVVPHLARNNCNANSTVSADSGDLRRATLSEHQFARNDTTASKLPAVSLTSLRTTARDRGDGQTVVQNYPVASASYRSQLASGRSINGAYAPPLPEASLESNQQDDDLPYDDLLGCASFGDDFDQVFPDEQGLMPFSSAKSGQPDQMLANAQKLSSVPDISVTNRIESAKESPKPVDIASGNNLVSDHNFKIGIFPSASSAENVHRSGSAFMA